MLDASHRSQRSENTVCGGIEPSLRANATSRERDRFRAHAISYNLAGFERRGNSLRLGKKCTKAFVNARSPARNASLDALADCASRSPGQACMELGTICYEAGAKAHVYEEPRKRGVPSRSA